MNSPKEKQTASLKDTTGNRVALVPHIGQYSKRFVLLTARQFSFNLLLKDTKMFALGK